MSDNENIEKKQAYLPFAGFNNARNFLYDLDFNNAEGILHLEQQLYELLKNNPENSEGLCLLLQEQLMNNRGQRARAIAYKIWELGGELAPQYEYMYINNLIDLGLLEMAGSALATPITDLQNNVGQYAGLLIKYAFATGNMLLLSRVLAYMPETAVYENMRDLVTMFEYLKVENQLPGLMSMLFSKVEDTCLGFDYILYTDRGFPDLEVVFYVDDTVKDLSNFVDAVNLQIGSYCAARKIEDIKNICAAIKPIARHPRLIKPVLEA